MSEVGQIEGEETASLEEMVSVETGVEIPGFRLGAVFVLPTLEISSVPLWRSSRRMSILGCLETS